MSNGNSVADGIDNRALAALDRPLISLLKTMGACSEALTWSEQFGTDYEAAWNTCERADHMFWLLGRLGVDRRLIVRAAVACVQPAVTAYVPAGEDRPQKVLDAATRWANDPSAENLRAVRQARRAAHAVGAVARAVAAVAHAVTAVTGDGVGVTGDGGMGAAGYVATLFLVIGCSLLIAVALWLPELAQWWGWL